MRFAALLVSSILLLPALASTAYAQSPVAEQVTVPYAPRDPGNLSLGFDYQNRNFGYRTRSWTRRRVPYHGPESYVKVCDPSGWQCVNRPANGNRYEGYHCYDTQARAGGFRLDSRGCRPID